MPRTVKPPEVHSKARRHFLGVAAAAAAKVGAMGILGSAALSSSAQAKNENNQKGWDIGVGNPHGSGGPHCFLPGTAIQTPSGEVSIEALAIGDLVETVSGKVLPIKWIGRQVYRKSGSSWPESVMPIRVARGALEERIPHADLYLSPMHALYLDGVLIPAKDLVNGVSITPALPDDREEIEYFQILLDSHEIILAEGAPAETLLYRKGVHENFTNFVEYERLYPDEPWFEMTRFAPLMGYGGRYHLRELLCLGVSRFVQMPDPLRDVYDLLTARAEGLVEEKPI